MPDVCEGIQVSCVGIIVIVPLKEAGRTIVAHIHSQVTDLMALGYVGMYRYRHTVSCLFRVK